MTSAPTRNYQLENPPQLCSMWQGAKEKHITAVELVNFAMLNFSEEINPVFRRCEKLDSFPLRISNQLQLHHLHLLSPDLNVFKDTLLEVFQPLPSGGLDLVEPLRMSLMRSEIGFTCLKCVIDPRCQFGSVIQVYPTIPKYQVYIQVYYL